MKINFKIKVLPLVFLAVLSQTACTDPETKRLKGEQECQVSRHEKYSFGFIGFLNPKKVIFREVTNGKITQEKMLEIYLSDMEPNEFVYDLPLTDEKNQNYYQIIVDDRYLFTLSEIKIYGFIRHVKFSDYIFCHIKEWKVNGKKHSDPNTRLLYKKDAIILPVANSKK